jgi:hypothetical protein
MLVSRRQFGSIFYVLPCGFVGFRTEQSPLFVAAASRQVKSIWSQHVLPTCRTSNSFSSGCLDATTAHLPEKKGPMRPCLSFVKLYSTRKKTAVYAPNLGTTLIVATITSTFNYNHQGKCMQVANTNY